MFIRVGEAPLDKARGPWQNPDMASFPFSDAPKRPQQDIPGCDEPLPQSVRHGLALFNRGAYYRCHDVLEEAWRAEEREVRWLYQGILQLAIALYHIQRGNGRGAMTMLARADGKFARLPDICQGVDVASLRMDIHMVRQQLQRLGPDGIHAFPEALFPRIFYPDDMAKK